MQLCLFRTLNDPYVFLQMRPQVLPNSLTVQWLISASGSYSRAADGLAADIDNSNLDDIEMCRTINDRIMMVRLLQFGKHLSDKCIFCGYGPLINFELQSIKEMNYHSFFGAYHTCF